MKSPSVASILLALSLAFPLPTFAQCVGEGCATYYPPYPATNNLPLGFFDFANTSGIYGWACDLDTPATAPAIHLYAGGPAGLGVLIGAVTANSTRESAVGERCGGYANRGFFFPIPPEKQHESFDVYAYAIDTTDPNQHTLLGSRRYTSPYPTYVPTPVFAPAYYPYYPTTYDAPQPRRRRTRRPRRVRAQTVTYPTYYYPTSLDDSRHFEAGDTRWCGSQLQYCGGTNAY